jgi:hypothetical protein
MEETLTRRQLLRRGALLPVVALPLVQGCDGGAGLCADPDMLSRGEEQMRKAREYTEISPFEQRNCAGCQFFRSYEEDACGHCEILDGPVSEGGYCTSWAA